MAQTATSAHAAEGPSEGVVDGILAEEMGAEIGEKLIEAYGSASADCSVRPSRTLRRSCSLVAASMQ
jgi:hypothetical protein